MAELSRGERLQIMLSPEELKTIDDWRFEARMPSRAAAIRELLRRGLQSSTVPLDSTKTKSADYGVVGEE